MVPADIPTPEPTVEEYFPDSLNPVQNDLMQDWLRSISLGEVILEQDLSAFLDRALNPIGPISSITTSKSFVNSNFVHDWSLVAQGGDQTPSSDRIVTTQHLTFPYKWRQSEGTNREKNQHHQVNYPRMIQNITQRHVNAYNTIL